MATVTAVQIEIGKKYKRSDKPYDVLTILDIILADGRVSVKCLEVYGFSDGPFYVDPEFTKDWERF